MIQKSSDYVLLDVLPHDHDTLPEERILPLADYDLYVPPIFVRLGYFFPLSPNADKDKIITDLKSGLEHTLARIPVFAGKLAYDTAQHPHVLQKKSDGVVLGIRHLDGENSSFPSLESWQKAGYPDAQLSAYREQLFPPGIEPSDLPLGIRMEAGCPMSAFQANFVPGGLILITAFHHYQGDATSCDIFCNSWAQASKALSEGTEIPMSFKPSFDRSYFNKPTSVPSEKRVKELAGLLKAFKLTDLNPDPASAAAASPDGTAAAATPAAAPADVVAQTFHFSKSNCARMKALCAPTMPGKFVSSYDCIVATVWRAMTRSRMPFHPEWDPSTQMTALASAVTVRDRFAVTSSHYVGNGVAASQTDEVTMDTLLSQSLGETALMSRASIQDITESTIPEMLELGKGTESTHRIELKSTFFFGSDLLISSWTKMNVFNYDFGFGTPTGFRAIADAVDGLAAVYPRCSRRGDDEGFEVCVLLEKGCAQRFAQDKELLEFSEVRGALVSV